jgi:hypothetical protein
MADHRTQRRRVSPNEPSPYGDLAAGELMTPRTELEAVPVTIRVEDLFRLAETTRFSRLPVYEGSLDRDRQRYGHDALLSEKPNRDGGRSRLERGSVGEPRPLEFGRRTILVVIETRGGVASGPVVRITRHGTSAGGLSERPQPRRCQDQSERREILNAEQRDRVFGAVPAGHE